MRSWSANEKISAMAFSFKSIREVAKKYGQEVAEGIQFYVDQGIQVVLVPPEMRQIRLNICENCDLFDQEQRRCTHCKCFMDIKTTLRYDPVESAKQGKRVKCACPINKW